MKTLIVLFFLSIFIGNSTAGRVLENNAFFIEAVGSGPPVSLNYKRTIYRNFFIRIGGGALICLADDCSFYSALFMAGYEKDLFSEIFFFEISRGPSYVFDYNTGLNGRYIANHVGAKYYIGSLFGSLAFTPHYNQSQFHSSIGIGLGINY